MPVCILILCKHINNEENVLFPIISECSPSFFSVVSLMLFIYNLRPFERMSKSSCFFSFLFLLHHAFCILTHNTNSLCSNSLKTIISYSAAQCVYCNHNGMADPDTSAQSADVFCCESADVPGSALPVWREYTKCTALVGSNHYFLVIGAYTN